MLQRFSFPPFSVIIKYKENPTKQSKQRGKEKNK